MNHMLILRSQNNKLLKSKLFKGTCLINIILLKESKVETVNGLLYFHGPFWNTILRFTSDVSGRSTQNATITFTMLLLTLRIVVLEQRSKYPLITKDS